jgi:glutamine amidotransferase
MPHIGIINTKICNMASVNSAFNNLDITCSIIEDSKSLEKCSHLILPGVGCFAKSIAYLHKLDLIEPLKKHINSNKPFLGICLGLQILAQNGDEFGHHKGLEIFNGSVKHLPKSKIGVLPHVGWNTVEHSGDGLFKNIPEKANFYFAHSYHFIPEDEKLVQATSSIDNYKFPVAIGHNNIYAVQFHPEKSSPHGNTLLKNFAQLC